MTNKKCPICEIEKPNPEFNHNSKTGDKLQTYCRMCSNGKKVEWQRKNRDRYNSYFRDKRANDTTYKLACRLRTRLRCALASQLTKKTSKTEELLGISFKEFRDYIEFMMTGDMNWGNIDLDHVRPLSSFDLTDPEQLKEASHYSNIQPLLKKENRRKGNRYNDHDLMVQIDRVNDYITFKYLNELSCCSKHGRSRETEKGLRSEEGDQKTEVDR